MKKNDENIMSLDWIRSLNLSNYSIVIGPIVLFIALSFLSPYFLTFDNINNLLMQMSINGIMAVGATFVIITGGIDLSVGSTMAASGICMGTMYYLAGENTLIAIITVLLVGAIFGSANGLLVSMGRVPPFIATLGMMQVGRGVALVIGNNQSISKYSDIIKWFGTGKILNIYVPIIIMLVVYTLAFIVLRYTPFGRRVYAVGGNAEASRLSGINIIKTKFLVYVISGALSGFAGLVLTGRLNIAHPVAGTGAELDVIASVVIGGTSLVGGKGGVIQTLIGALIVQLIRNGLNLMNVSVSAQQIIIGLVIICTVLFDSIKNRERQ